MVGESYSELRNIVRRLKPILKYVLAAFFVLAGFNHFISPTFYLKMMPPYLPWHLVLVYLSGLFEIALAILLLIPKFTHIAAWGLIALLIAVFPANIHMAANHELFPEYRAMMLWLRLPLQFALITLSYWYTLPVAPQRRSRDAASSDNLI